MFSQIGGGGSPIKGTNVGVEDGPEGQASGRDHRATGGGNAEVHDVCRHSSDLGGSQHVRSGRADSQAFPNGRVTRTGLENRILAGGVGVGGHLEANRGLAGFGEQVLGDFEMAGAAGEGDRGCGGSPGRRQLQIAYAAQSRCHALGTGERYEIWGGRQALNGEGERLFDTARRGAKTHRTGQGTGGGEGHRGGSGFCRYGE